MLERVKGSKVVNFCLVSKKNLSQKMAHWIGAQGRVKVAKKRKTPLLVTFPAENPKHKTKNVFFFKIN